MKFTANSSSASETTSEALVVGVYENGVLTSQAELVNQATDGVLTKLIEAKEISGKINELVPILAPSGISATQVLVVGLGKQADFNRRAAYEVCASAAKQLASKEHQQVAFFLAEDWQPAWIENGIAGILSGSNGQDLYRAEKKIHPFQEVLWYTPEESQSATEESLATGQILGESINLTRRLVNEPPQAMYPETFADAAQQVAAVSNLEIEIWDQARLEEERCGSLLAVARGSVKEPRLVIVKHNGGGENAPTLALVGKGVTFDSGGLSLKPNDGMLTMKCDMAGAATVLGAMQAIAQLKLPVNVVGMMGLVENMPSADAFKLGDVLTARNGKTIEVHNTDAEGRLVLADVLSVAVGRGVSKIIDLATLTGACVVALGLDTVGAMTNDQQWCNAVLEAAQSTGEKVWQLPMYPEFGEQIKSEIADIKNVGEGRWGGAITAGKFLEEFVGDTPWTHLDIAGPAFFEKPKSWSDAGGSGYMVRTLVEVVRNWK